MDQGQLKNKKKDKQLIIGLLVCCSCHDAFKGGCLLLNIQGDVIVRTFTDPDDDLFDTGVDDHALAHGAAHGIGQQRIVLAAAAGKIDRGADHIPAGCGNDGIGFRVNAAAQLITLSGGDVHRFPGTFSDVGTVESSARGTVIAGGDDLIVSHDDGTVFSSQTGGAFGNGIRDIQIIIDFAST